MLKLILQSRVDLFTFHKFIDITVLFKVCILVQRILGKFSNIIQPFGTEFRTLEHVETCVMTCTLLSTLSRWA